MALGSSTTSQPGTTELGQVVRGAGVFATVPGAGVSTSVVTRVPVNVADVILIAENAVRVGASVYNNSATQNLFVKLGKSTNIGVGTESFTVRLVPGAFYEIPAGYFGDVSGIWQAADANGEALVTEIA